MPVENTCIRDQMKDLFETCRFPLNTNIKCIFLLIIVNLKTKLKRNVFKEDISTQLY